MTKPIHPPSEDLFAYRDGELAPEKRSFVEAHVHGCSACRSMIDQVSALEAELRRGPDTAPAGYLEHLHENVRARIAASGAIPRRDAASEAAGSGAARPERGGRDRRRPEEGDFAREGGRIREAPKLPWGAILSTAGAGAAVIVVAIILVRGGIQNTLRIPQREPEIAQAPPAGTEEGGAKGVPGEPKRQAGPTQAGEAGQGKASGSNLGSADERRGVTAGTTAPGAPSARNEADLQKKETAATRKDDDLVMHRMSQEVSGAPSQNVAPQAALGMRDAFEEQRSRAQAAGDYDALVRKYGLPRVWTPQVSAGALERAEPSLRLLYITGRAGADSARIRLYLAEAARLRYAPGDTTLYEDIARHYRRAIRLAGPDAQAAHVAEERLRTLER